MGLREDALRRILALDAGRSAQLSLRLAQDVGQAHSGAVIAIDGDRYVLFATTELVEEDLQHVGDAWSTRRRELLRGHQVGADTWALLPIGRPVTGLLYIGRAQVRLETTLLRQAVAELGQLLEVALSVRSQEPESRMVYETLIQRTPLSQIARRKLELILRFHDGNKTRAAETLGVTRATLYKWLKKHGLGTETDAETA
jgi:DNA-binding protein Fis